MKQQHKLELSKLNPRPEINRVGSGLSQELGSETRQLANSASLWVIPVYLNCVSWLNKNLARSKPEKSSAHKSKKVVVVASILFLTPLTFTSSATSVASGKCPWFNNVSVGQSCSKKKKSICSTEMPTKHTSYAIVITRKATRVS